MHLSDFPAELLGRICKFVDSSSLRDFSLVDKACRSTAVPVLFETISIEPDQALEFTRMLQSKGYPESKHVRTLEIRSELPSTIRYEQETFPDPTCLASFEADGNERSWHMHAQDPSWRPTLELLEELPAVKDLIWTCPQQFPPSLLRCLQEQLQSCRLHLRTFRLRSLVKGFEDMTDLYELMLVQSPNLYSIWSSYDIADTWNNVHKMPEAVSRTVQGLAPNLCQVRLWQNIMGAEPDYSGYASLMRPLESATSMLSHERGSLRSLQFAGESQDLTAPKVEEWSRRTDFTVMEKLSLDCYLTPAVLVQLAAYSFSGLTTLDLRLTVEKFRDDPHRPDPDNSSKPAQDFLCSIPPLKALHLSGEIVFDRLRGVILHHGKTLQTLHIEPMGYSPYRLSLLPEEVSWITEHCSVLEDLRLTMHRSSGDKSEAAAYLSIGRMQKLQSLILTLDASDFTSLRHRGERSEDYMAKPKADFDDFGRENSDIEDYNVSSDPRKGHIMEMFINAALDERLARSIYSRLSSARPTRAFVLDSVEIQSDGCGDFGTTFVPPEVAKVANEIQHRWLFKREYGFDSGSGDFKVSELEHKNRLSTTDESIVDSISNVEDDENTNSDSQLDERIESIFRHLWPVKADKSSWQSDWHSFELSD